MLTKEKIRAFVDEKIKTYESATDFLDLDSLDKLELVMDCEKQFEITIYEDDITYDFNTDMFVDMIIKNIEFQRANPNPQIPR